jgi:hypothetical protein
LLSMAKGIPTPGDSDRSRRLCKLCGLEIRAEAINALNHPILNSPGMCCSGVTGAACIAGYELIGGSTQSEPNLQAGLKHYL